jgi:hypothetical protein
MVGVRDKVLLPDTIDGVPVDVDYDKLAEYDQIIEATKSRYEADRVFQEVKKANQKADLIATAIYFVLMTGFTFTTIRIGMTLKRNGYYEVAFVLMFTGIMTFFAITKYTDAYLGLIKSLFI